MTNTVDAKFFKVGWYGVTRLIEGELEFFPIADPGPEHPESVYLEGLAWVPPHAVSATFETVAECRMYIAEDRMFKAEERAIKAEEQNVRVRARNRLLATFIKDLDLEVPKSEA